MGSLLDHVQYAGQPGMHSVSAWQRVLGEARFARPHANAEAVFKVGGGKAVFVREVVAEVNRYASGERLARHQFGHGLALVHALGLQLNDEIAGLHFITMQLWQRGFHRMTHRFEVLGRGATVNRNGELLVFDQRAGVRARDGFGRVQRERAATAADARLTHLAVGVAQLQAMQTGHRPRRRAKQAIQVDQAPSADQRQRTIECGVKIGEQDTQAIRDHDLFGTVGKRQQRAVNVEEQGPTIAGRRQWRGGKHGRNGHLGDKGQQRHSTKPNSPNVKGAFDAMPAMARVRIMYGRHHGALDELESQPNVRISRSSGGLAANIH